MDEFMTREKAGNAATIFTGQLASVYNHPVISSIALRKTDSAGYMDTGATVNEVYGSMVTFNRNACKWGWRRRIKTETERRPGTDQTFITSSLRLGFGRFTPTGAATATFGLLGQGSVRTGATSGGTPTSAAYTAFNKAQGSITRSSVALAQVTGARLTYANGMEAVRTIRADRRVEGVDPGIARCTGQITVRFENTTLLAQAQAGTSAEFALAFTIDANRSLTITLHEVYLALAKTPIEGPAGVEASFDFRAAFNATATRMMTAVLRNQQAGTEYA
jgi:hypothetical protein